MGELNLMVGAILVGVHHRLILVIPVLYETAVFLVTVMLQSRCVGKRPRPRALDKRVTFSFHSIIILVSNELRNKE